MVFRFKATLHYFYKNKEFTITDIYRIPLYYSLDYIHEYIKHDLMLVAGGGYSTDNVKVIDFEIKQV